MGDDIHTGLDNDNMTNNVILFSIGHRCTSASLVKELHLKFESYPFDWVVSKLEVVIHCIETDFAEYTKPENYREVKSETFNLCDGVKRHICYENIVYNDFYEHYPFTSETDIDKYPNTRENTGTYGRMLALTHHDIRKERDRGYFQRCVDRFKRILALSQQKFYLYSHPLLGVDDFESQSPSLLLYFIDFVETFKTKTANAHGIFFVLVKNETRKHEVVPMFASNDLSVFVVYANNNLVDGGGVYDGDFYNEQHKILTTIERVIASKQH